MVSQAPGNPPLSNSLLFKTANPSETLGQPVGAGILSPFAPSAAPSSQPPGLTVGDLLPALPQDVAKNPGLPPSQPVAIPEAVLENALRSGRPVLPIFEIYRACPALFQAPVGPNDTREVPLPTHKLAQLLPAKPPGAAPMGSPGVGVMPASPFSNSGSPFMPAAAAATTASSPFSMAAAPSVTVPEPPAAAAPESPTTLFHPSPFSMAMAPEAAAAAAASAGGAPNGGMPPMNNPFVSAPDVTASSPFSFASPTAMAAAPAPAPMEPRPVASAPEAMPLGSLFGGPPPTGTPPSSPFGQNFGLPPAGAPGSPSPSPSPFGMSPAAGSPFSGSPFAPANGGPAFGPPQDSPFAPGVPVDAPENGVPDPLRGMLVDDTPMDAGPGPGMMGPPGMAQGSPFSPFSAPQPPPAFQPFTAAVNPSPNPGPGVGSPFLQPTPAPKPIFPTELPPADNSPAGPPSPFSFGPPPQEPASSPPPSFFTENAAGSPPAMSVADIPTPPGADNPFARIQALSRALAQASMPGAMTPPSAPPATNLPEEMFGKAYAPATPLPQPQPQPQPEPESAPLPPMEFSPAIDFGKTDFAKPASPFGAPASEPPAVSGFIPAIHEEETSDGPFSMGLSAALKSCAPHDLGTVPENIPAWVKFTVPKQKVQLQLGTGKVRLPLDEILAGVDPDIRRMFSAARAGLMVDLDINTVFHALSESSAAATPSVPLFTPADAPEPPAFAAPAEPKIKLGMPPFVPSGADPFAPRTESAWKKESLPPAPPAEMPMPAPESLGSSPFWGDTPDTKPPVSSFMLVESEEPEKPLSPFPALQSKVEAPKPLFADTAKAAASVQQSSAPPVVIPANPVTGTPELISEPPVVLPPKAQAPEVKETFIPAPKPAPKAAAPTPSVSATTRHLLLTVLLGSPQAENLDTFIKLTRQLPGVAAAVCLREGRTLASQGDGTTEADRFIREASANAKMLPALAALTGIADTDTLHIQSGHGEATFCLHDDVVLAVLHNPDKREAVLREKITLLGRELAAIVRERDVA